MAKWQGKILKWFVKKMDLPADAALDLPRITMIGQLHIYIENHEGVIRFSDHELRLALQQGQLQILGESFIIKTILPDEILLEGKISQVVFLEMEK